MKKSNRKGYSVVQLENVIFLGDLEYLVKSEFLSYSEICRLNRDLKKLKGRYEK